MTSKLYNINESVLITSVDDLRQLLVSGIHYEYIVCLDAQSVQPLSDARIPSKTIYWLDIENNYRRSDELRQSILAPPNLHSSLLQNDYYRGIYLSTIWNTSKIFLCLKDLGISTLYFWPPCTLSFDTRGHITDILKFLLIEQSIDSSVRLIPLMDSYTFLSRLKSRALRVMRATVSFFLQRINLIRLIYFLFFIRPSVVLFGSGIPVADAAYAHLSVFRLDHFQNDLIPSFYKKYLRTLDIRKDYDLYPSSESLRLQVCSCPKYVEHISLLIRHYSRNLSQVARLHRQFFDYAPSVQIAFSDNLSYFTYLLIRQCSSSDNADTLRFIPHSIARRETLWSRLFDIKLPYLFACSFSYSQAIPAVEPCRLTLNSSPVFVYYSYSHSKRGVLKFNPCFPDDVFLLLRSIDRSSVVYVGRKPGSESLYNLADLTRHPVSVRPLYSETPSYEASAVYILAIGHWGQIHSCKLYEGHTVLYFGEDVSQVPFRSVPVGSFSSADNHNIYIEGPYNCFGNLYAWLILPPCSDNF